MRKTPRIHGERCIEYWRLVKQTGEELLRVLLPLDGEEDDLPLHVDTRRQVMDLDQYSLGEDTPPFEEGEILEALQTMQNGKAPGLDGIPAEAWCVVWTSIVENVHIMFNDFLDQGNSLQGGKMMTLGLS